MSRPPSWADRAAVGLGPEALLRQLDHLAVVGRHEARGAEQVGLTQTALGHLGRVVGEAEVGPDEVEGPRPARHDVPHRQRVDLLLDDQPRGTGSAS
jgi:hypothetical protein